MRWRLARMTVLACLLGAASATVTGLAHHIVASYQGATYFASSASPTKTLKVST